MLPKTRISAAASLWLCLLLGAFAACSEGGSDQVDSCRGGFLAGDLVITEVMANAVGADEGKEWLEIYNASGQEALLEGVTLVAAKADGTSKKSLSLTDARIAAGDYFVLGNILPELQPDHIDYAYGAALGTLGNSGGMIELRCGDVLVDRMIYGEAPEGVSLSFDGSQVPDALANDTLDSWCESRSLYDGESAGTPGGPNDPCEGTVPPSSCLENGQAREIRVPQAGDLVITEVMANPEAVADADGEWLEVYVGRDIDLNGLQLGKTAGVVVTQITTSECLPAAAGSYLLFAANPSSEANGGLPSVVAEIGFGLTNSGGSAFVGFADQVLDEVSYSAAPAGASLSLDPGKLSPVDNDNPDYWCTAQETYGAGDKGTPGTANPSCGIVEEGHCLEGGSSRLKRVPVVGDLVINELMANPEAVSDANGEWFEVYVARDVDLNGLQLGKAVGAVEQTLPEGECLSAAAGSYLLFARKSDPEVNGGLPAVDLTFSFSLNNRDSGLVLSLDDTLLDAVSYSASTAATATSLDPQAQDPQDNDDPLNWCPAVDTYGDGDRGTPGAANPACL